MVIFYDCNFTLTKSDFIEVKDLLLASVFPFMIASMEKSKSTFALRSYSIAYKSADGIFS
jgi:hypothetical protein